MMRDVGGLVDRKKENLFVSERDERVIIRQGELLAGKICKKTVGSSSGSLIHLLWNEAGPERTKDFLGALQKLVNFWLLHQGFTVGCSDIITSQETCKKVEEILKEAKDEVAHLTRLAHQGRLEAQPGKSLRESFEARVNKELNAAREKSGKIASEQLDESNNIMAMVLLLCLLSSSLGTYVHFSTYEGLAEALDPLCLRQSMCLTTIIYAGCAKQFFTRVHSFVVRRVPCAFRC